MGEITGKKVVGECSVYDFKIICVFTHLTQQSHVTLHSSVHNNIVSLGQKIELVFAAYGPILSVVLM